MPRQRTTILNPNGYGVKPFQVATSKRGVREPKRFHQLLEHASYGIIHGRIHRRMKRILAGHHRARVRVCTSAGRQRAVESSVAELLPHPELVLPHRELVLPHREVVLPVRSTCSRSAPGAGGPSPGAGGDREEDREKTGSTSSGSTSASAPHGAGTELPYGAPAPGGRWRTDHGAGPMRSKCGANAELELRTEDHLPHPEVDREKSRISG